LPKRTCVEHVPGEGKSLLQIQILPSAGVPQELCVDLERDQRQIAEDREILDRIERIKRKNGSKPWNLIPNDRNHDRLLGASSIGGSKSSITAETQSTQQEEDLRGVRDRKQQQVEGKGSETAVYSWLPKAKREEASPGI
jgi:hypothetical protein